jgi:DNA-binding transcriptional LysR family regulator
MDKRAEFDKIELYLIRVLVTLISERSVSRAAMRLASTQPAVSAQLKRLRELTGDPLLVRAGNGMAPTDTAMRLVERATNLLQEAEHLFGSRARIQIFDASTSEVTFRVAASDYMDPLFLPHLVAHLKHEAPLARIELAPLTSQYDYRRYLASGEVDLVIGNWLQPPDELHLSPLITDEVVCLVSADHPMSRQADSKNWTIERYLACEHIAPMPLHPGAVGVIDEHLVAQSLQRNIMVRSAHFGLIPLMVSGSLLVMTTGRLFCTRYLQALPVRIVRCPVPFPPLIYYQLWHDLTHKSPPMRWFREQVRHVAHRLSSSTLPSHDADRADH